MKIRVIRSICLLSLLSLPVFSLGKEIKLLNVSYEPTSGFYQEFNGLFSTYWKRKTGVDVTIYQSHGGSGKQARAVMDGLEADVVSLALSYDIDAIAKRSKLISADWQTKFPFNSSPFYSTVVFLVREGNPKSIHDWDDLIRPDVSVITANPKTSGGARWNYIAAWGYAIKKFNGNEQKAKNFLQQVFKNVPVLDTGARAASITFARREIGDVLLSWENEAYLTLQEMGDKKFDVVIPSISVLAEPCVAIVNKNAQKKGTQEVAQAYVDFLYSREGQSIASRHFFRVREAPLKTENEISFPSISLFTLADIGLNWELIHKTHFSEGGVFDQLYTAGKTN